MAKMFYTTEEAAAKLSATPDQVKQYITDNKLREFRDGNRVMFKVDQVDRLANDIKGGSKAGLVPPRTGSDSGIDLAPHSTGLSSGMDAISLTESAGPTAAAKDDTVMVASSGNTGKTVLDTGSPKSPADSAAQTQIQSAIDDQFSLDGVGSGSGLLDLTRERDDTSLGAELLDEIYPGGEGAKPDSGIGSSSGIFEPSAAEVLSGPSGLEHVASTPVTTVGQAEIVEAYDSTSGFFGGMAIAATLAIGLTIVIILLNMQDLHPEWVKALTGSGNSLIIFCGCSVLLTILLALVGLFIGKATRRS